MIAGPDRLHADHMFCGVHVTRPSVMARLPGRLLRRALDAPLDPQHLGPTVWTWYAPKRAADPATAGRASVSCISAVSSDEIRLVV